ncbi:MAG: integrase [Nitrospiraceae bacterium]|nr:MAG: integrase [Nitrospiraceae bacterium]
MNNSSARPRRAIQESPFHGEGHRKVCAPPRRTHFPAARAAPHASAPVARRRSRQPQPVEPKRHEGRSSPNGPSEVWGIDATAGFTLRDGQVAIFAMIDHGSAFCLGIHVAKRGTRFEALEPLRQAVREQFGSFSEGTALGVKLRHDHGSRFMSDDFQREIRFLGLVSSPAFVREPEGNGSIERFFRTLKEQLLWARHFDTLEQLAEALEQFRQRYNERWLVERLHFRSPQQALQALLALEPAA